MADIKKKYSPLVEFLELNKRKKVSAVLDEVYRLAAARKTRSGGPTFILNDARETVAIECSFFRRWLPLVGKDAVQFNVDSESASGYNRMCVEGRAQWTEKQRVATKEHNSLLDRIDDGLTMKEVKRLNLEIEATRRDIEPCNKGFETQDEMVRHLIEIGILQPEADNE